MKILQIIQRPQLRGAEIFACQLSQHLIQMGHQVDILILFGDNKKRLPFDLIFFHLHANESKRWWDLSAYKRLSDLIINNRYDVVQANAGDTLKYASLSKLFYKWKAKLVFRNANKMGDFLTSPFKKRLNKWLLGRVDFVASVSEECKLDFERTFGFKKKPVASLPIGVELQDKSFANPLLALGIKADAPVLLSVAGFVQEKNHIGLLSIFQQVHKHFGNAILLLVGEGKLQDLIKRQVTAMSLEKSVHFLGRRNDVSALMQHAQLLLLPSLIEGLPAVILEAFNNKLPVVAYNVGGIPEVIQHRKTGWLIPKNNENQFALAVVELLSSAKDEIDAVVDAARRLAFEEYDNRKIADRFQQAYYQVIHHSVKKDAILNG